MQMPISQPAPSAGQASSKAQAGGTATAKTAVGDPFGKKLVQTIADASAEASEQTGAAGGTKVQPNAASDLSALLGEHATVADLLAAIGELLKKLASLDDQDQGDGGVSQDDLAEALKKLEELLGALGVVPVMINVPAVQAQAAVPAEDNRQTASDANAPVVAVPAPAADAGAAVAEALTPSVAAVAESGHAAAQQSGTSEEDGQEAMAALKAGLQEALVDLRDFLQQGKGTKRDANASIGKQLAAIGKLLGGGDRQEETTLWPAPVPAHEEDAASAVRVWHNASAANSHLQRLANQPFHAAMMSVLPQHEEAESTAPAVGELAVPTGSEAQAAPGQELQRQLQTVRPVIQQPVPVQQFAETMRNLVVKQFDLSSAGGISEARISLSPEHLGQVDVKITMHNGLLTALFLTDTSSAKDMLENQMAMLRSSLQSQGLQIDKLEVAQSSVQPNLFQERQGGGGKEQQPGGRRSKAKDEAVSGVNGFEADLEESRIELAVDRHMGLGRGIHTTA